MEEDLEIIEDFLDITEVVLPKYSTAKPKYCISEEFKIAVKNMQHRLEQDERVIEEMAEFLFYFKSHFLSLEEYNNKKQIIDRFRKKCE